MKKSLIVGALFLSSLAPFSAQAVSIHLNVGAPSGVLYTNTLDVAPCAVTDDLATTTVNAKCALEQAGLNPQWSNYGGDDWFLTTVGGVSQDFGNNLYWNWWSDLSCGQVALNKHELHDGESVLVALGVLPLRANAAPSVVGASTTVTVEEFGFDASFNAVWTPSANATLALNGVMYQTGALGTVDFVATSTDPVTLTVSKVNFVSATLALTPSGPAPVPTVSIHLDVETPTGSVYSNTLDVSPCVVASDPGVTTVNAKCALEQAGLNPQWSSYGGDDLFLTSAGGATQDFANNLYWNWWTDFSYGQVALNKHELGSNESLLITLGLLPLRFGTAPSAVVGATTSVRLEEFGFDANYNGAWTPSATTTVVVNGVTYETNSSGALDFVATSTDTLTLVASKTSFVSATLALMPTTAPVVTTSSPTIVASGGGSTTSSSLFNVSNALAYLASEQHPDGSFDAPFLSDWATLAFVASGQSSRIRDYMRSSTPTLSSVTDYERHAMALEALGINPYTGTAVDYIAPIVRAFDGTQIGDVHLDNDDVFAILPLLSAGYSSSDTIISKTTAFILSAQQANGSWDASTDMTAAAIQALTEVDELSGVSSAIARAKSFLHTAQVGNGGFGNSFSTSWALQAISALDESPSNWASNSLTPLDALATFQQSDGGVEPLSSSVQTRVWATAYAISAALGKSWSTLLHSFPKPVSPGGNSLGQVLGASITATSTLPVVASTTPPAATSTAVVSTIVLKSTPITPPVPVIEAKIVVPKVETAVATSVTALASETAAAATSTPGFWSRFWGAIATFLSNIL